MENTMYIQLINQRAVKLLYELEQLNLIKVLKENIVPKKIKLSDKYRGIIGEKTGKELDEHILKMRNEWNGI